MEQGEGLEGLGRGPVGMCAADWTAERRDTWEQRDSGAKAYLFTDTAASKQETSEREMKQEAADIGYGVRSRAGCKFF